MLCFRIRCLVVNDRDGRGGFDDRQQSDIYEEDQIVDDESFVDEEEEEREENLMEEITEEEGEEMTTTTTTVVETPGAPVTDELTCSAEDQGFGDATPVEAFVVLPPEGCDWSENPADLPQNMGLGFIDVVDDTEYTNLFECGSQSPSSDIDWESEAVVYLSGWIPAGSEPEFEWALSSGEDKIVLGLVSVGVCTDDVEFYQNAFITPRRAQRPRVISCVMPTEC